MPQNWRGPGGVSAEPPYQSAACKPGSVGPRASSPTRDGHSSATPVARRLKQPTRTAIRTRISGPCAPLPSLFGLAPGGVCRAVSVAGNAVRSYRTVSPLPRPIRNAPRRSVLCGTFPGVAPAGRYPAPFVRGARTFLPGHLSAIAGAAVRPTDGVGMGWQRPPSRGRPYRRWVRRAGFGSGFCASRSRAIRASAASAASMASAMPSTRAGRKWRWKAVTTSRGAAS